MTIIERRPAEPRAAEPRAVEPRPLRERGPHGGRAATATVPARVRRAGPVGREAGPVGRAEELRWAESILAPASAADSASAGVVPASAASSAVAGGRSPGPYYALCSVVGVLSLIGLVMVLSASSVLSLQTFGTPWYYFEKQLTWLVLGTAAFVIGVTVNPSRWRKVARVAMWVAVGLLFAVLVPGVGVSASGASRWLGSGSFQIQPSEVAKLALVFFAADVIERRGEKGRRWTYEMGPVLAVLALLVALVMKQPDMGTTLVLVFIGFAILLTAGMPAKPILKLVALAVAAAGVLAVVSPYRLSRLTAYLHPEANAQGSGFQSVQALAGLSDGGVLGHGIGSSIASWGFLPNAQTDFIFAVIGEETGLVGSIAVGVLFAVLAFVGIKIACRASDRYLALVAAGITAWLSGQAVINIGAVVGLLPVTGVPLPFVSFGGSSLVFALFASGVLAAVAKQR